MHEYGHNLGFNHGGNDGINCKPNYRSVMSYSRQFAGSPIVNRRLDYSRSEDPVLTDQTKTGVLREVGGLDESVGLGNDPSLGPISPFFPSTDVIVFGPNAWSLQTPATAKPINWNRATGTQTNASANINAATATAGCDGSGDVPFGHRRLGQRSLPGLGGDQLRRWRGFARDDQRQRAGLLRAPRCRWQRRRRTSIAAVRSPDGTPGFKCTHRLAVLDAIAQPANFRIVIFSEKTGNDVWNAPVQVISKWKKMERQDARYSIFQPTEQRIVPSRSAWETW